MTRKIKPVRIDKVFPLLLSRAPAQRRHALSKVLVKVRDADDRNIEVIDVGLVFDRGELGPKVATPRHLKALDSTIEALHETALSNLRAASAPTHWRSPEGTPWLIYDPPDMFAAERILILAELIDPWPLGGVFATAMPGVLVCLPTNTISDLEDLSMLAQMASDREGVGSQLFWHDGAKAHPIYADDRGDVAALHMPAPFARRLAEMASLAITTGTTPAEA